MAMVLMTYVINPKSVPATMSMSTRLCADDDVRRSRREFACESSDSHAD